MAAAAVATTKPAKAPKTLAPRLIANSAEWRMRALQIADRDHLTGTARWESQHSGAYRGVESFSVPSRTSCDEHTVSFACRDSIFTCDCMAAQHGLPCGHVGAVVYRLGQVAVSFGITWGEYWNVCGQQYNDLLTLSAPDAGHVAYWRAAVA